MFCHKCGKEVKEGAAACEACGAVVGQAAPAAAAPVNQAHAATKNPWDYFKEVVTQKYAQFDGRATRSEYWYFVLVSVLIQMALGIIEGMLSISPDSKESVLAGLFNLAVFVPSIAVGIRRMHDTNRSGWWILFPIVNIVFFCQDGTAGENKYGTDPKGRTSASKAA